MTLSRLAELRALLGECRSLPWAGDPCEPREFGGDLQGSEGEWGVVVGETYEPEDARLIVAAVNSLPALLDIAEAAEAYERCLKAEMDSGATLGWGDWTVAAQKATAAALADLRVALSVWRSTESEENTDA